MLTTLQVLQGLNFELFTQCFEEVWFNAIAKQYTNSHFRKMGTNNALIREVTQDAPWHNRAET